MIHFAAAIENHCFRDALARIGAEPQHRVLGVQILPQPQEHPVTAIVFYPECFELLAPLFRSRCRVFDARDSVLFLLLGLLQLPRQFDDDLVGFAVNLNDLVQQPPKLIEPDMHGWIGDAAKAGDLVVVFIIGSWDDMPVPALRHNMAGGRGTRLSAGRMVPAAVGDRLGISHDAVLQHVQNAGRRRQTQSAVALWKRRPATASAWSRSSP